MNEHSQDTLLDTLVVTTKPIKKEVYVPHFSFLVRQMLALADLLLHESGRCGE